MKRIIVTALWALAGVCFVSAQSSNESPHKTECKLTVAQAPELRGFRLGMTEAQVVARLPEISFEAANEVGRAKLRLSFVDPENYPGRLYSLDRGAKGVQPDSAAGTDEGRSYLVDSSKFPEFKGIKKIRIHLFDGRVAMLQVAYDDSVKWHNPEEFAQTLSKTLGLPDGWQEGFDSENYRKNKILVCENLLITAGLGGDSGDYRVGSQLSLEDEAATQTIVKRYKDLVEKRKREEEERRKTFKP